MSESKVPYRIITAFSYPGGTHYTVRGPGLDEFGDDISYEAAERECPRLNAAFAAGAASRDAEIERLRAEVAELRSESEQMCKELNEVLDANGVTWGSGPNDTYAGHFKLLIERLRAEAYHTAPGELEFGGEGWTWKQQARANEDRLRELEAEVARLGGVVAAAVQAEQVARECVKVLEDACRSLALSAESINSDDGNGGLLVQWNRSPFADILGPAIGHVITALNPAPPANTKESA